MKINGPAFTKARQDLLLGLVELSNKAEVTFKTLLRVERSQSVKLVSLRKIIEALGLTIEEALSKKMIELEDEATPPVRNKK
jgi:predicted transcriptional regulator